MCSTPTVYSVEAIVTAVKLQVKYIIIDMGFKVQLGLSDYFLLSVYFLPDLLLENRCTPLLYGLSSGCDHPQSIT